MNTTLVNWICSFCLIDNVVKIGTRKTNARLNTNIMKKITFIYS